MMIANDIMRNDVTPLQPETTVASALQQMEETKVSHLPMVDGAQKFSGVLSESQLYDVENEALILAESRLHPISVSIQQTAHLFEAIGLFGEYNLSMLPVIDEDQNYLGYLHPQDVVVDMGKMLSSKIPGGIVVLEVNQFDYQLSQIAQIVESNGAKIIATFFTSSAKSSRMEVAIKINQSDLSTILKTFERYEYNIKAVFHKSKNDTDLALRYENLMNYLNI